MKYAKKSLGQNYLIDLNIINKIVDLSKTFDKNILEIGPGKGALTDQILKNKPKSLILIEKDYLLYQELKKKYQNIRNVVIFNKDILKFNFENKIKDKTIIFGNLPYNISSQVLAKIIKFKKWPPKYSDLILMFQKELAEKIIGKFNTSKYGRLSILANYRLKLASKFDVSPNCFRPKPKVNSTVLYLKPIQKITYKIQDIKNLEKVTNILFSNKRKMINKNLKKIFNKKKLDLLKNFNLKLRPSDISPEKYYEITQLFEKN
ncbi:MAG: ribosomal RNA small subunit methyltransferase A [Candidatus Pelagibacter sp. TMED128]|nr:MAG: ribosomal RNA small subunit methyltransferase A [Candidatus Pelagibacter sp. TMED128]|tara:strand:- start:759 stop:1544 length:786 start_codon:yes stop_codon:yes gene_type:complete